MCAVLAGVCSAIGGADGGTAISYVASSAGIGMLMLVMRDLRVRNMELNEARAELADMAVAEERERFARDLHDLLGHSLSVIALKAELAGRLLADGPPAAAREVAELEQVARTALGEVRDAVSGYRQPTLDGELAGARMALSAAGIQADVQESRVSLDPAVEAVLAWAVREGATNVIRHSGARHCTFKVSASLTDAGVEVIDDGHGATDQRQRCRRGRGGRGGAVPAVGAGVRAGGAGGRCRRPEPAGRAQRRRQSPRQCTASGAGTESRGWPSARRCSTDGSRRVRSPAAATGSPSPSRSRTRDASAAGVIRVLLAEDQTMVRGALASLLDLEPDIEVVAQASRGDEVLAAAVASTPDVALLDIEMPGSTGLDAADELRRALPDCRILILTTFGRPGYLRRAMEGGAAGFLLKDAPATELAAAIRRAVAGERVVDPGLAAAALSQGESPLTPREHEVLLASREHATVADLAGALYLSPGTVRNHLSSAMQKLDARNRAEAVRVAEEKGWL